MPVSTTRGRGREAASRAICGAPKPRGGVCQRAAGKGTDHDGIGRCYSHGGNDPEHLKEVLSMASAATALVPGTAVMGIPIAMDPTDALTWCVSIAAGEVAYLTQKVQELTEEQLIARPRHSSREYGLAGTGKDGDGEKDLKRVELGPDALHLLIVERQAAVDRLAKLAKMALDAGVAERQVRLAEQQGDMIYSILSRFMEAVGLTSKQRTIAEQVLPDILLTLEAPAS